MLLDHQRPIQVARAHCQRQQLLVLEQPVTRVAGEHEKPRHDLPRCHREGLGVEPDADPAHTLVPVACPVGVGDFVPEPAL